MTVDDRKKEIDEKIAFVLECPQEEKDRVYLMLNKQGCHLEGIEDRIERIIREQCR